MEACVLFLAPSSIAKLLTVKTTFYLMEFDSTFVLFQIFSQAYRCYIFVVDVFNMFYRFYTCQKSG